MATKAKPKSTEATAKSEASTRATLAEKALRIVRDNHKQEYQEVLAALCAEAGIPFRVRLHGDEAKRAKAEALAAELGLALVPATATPDAE